MSKVQLYAVEGETPNSPKSPLVVVHLDNNTDTQKEKEKKPKDVASDKSSRVNDNNRSALTQQSYNQNS